MEQLSDPKSQSQSHSPNHSTASKIKPLILNTANASFLGEPHIHTELKKAKANLRAIRSVCYRSQDRNLDYFKKVTKILRKQNFPSELFIVCTPHEVFPIRYFLSKIRNLASSALPQLTLRSSIAFSGLKTDFKNLSSLKNLTHLNFEFTYTLDMKEDPKALKTLFLSFGRLKKLRHLSIKIDSDRDGKKMSSYITHLKQLQSLKLILGNWKLSQYTSLIPNLPHLTQFDLYFSGIGNIRGEDFLSFYMSFQYAKALTDLTVDISDYSLHNATDIESLAEGLNSLNPSLMKKVRLKLCDRIPIDGLMKIYEAIKKFTRLHAFDLYFPYCPYDKTNKITGPLSSTLSELGSLKSLKICLHDFHENQFTVNDITTALESLQNLVSLELYFPKEDTPKDEQIQKFSSNLKNLKGLRYLDLRFDWQQSVSDLAFESLSESLKGLIHLKTLSLSFESTQGVTNKAVSVFCCAVKGLKNLTGLTLKLPKSDIDVKAIEEVAQMLREMPQLSDVSFRFDKCLKIKKKRKNKGDALASLFQALKESKNIKKITLKINASLFNKRALEDLKLAKGGIYCPWD